MVCMFCNAFWHSTASKVLSPVIEGSQYINICLLDRLKCDVELKSFNYGTQLINDILIRLLDMYIYISEIPLIADHCKFYASN